MKEQSLKDNGIISREQSVALNAIDGSIWFLSYLLYCYIIFYVVFKYIKDIKLALG